MSGWWASLALFIVVVMTAGAFSGFWAWWADAQCRERWSVHSYEGRFVAGEGCQVKLDGVWMP